MTPRLRVSLASSNGASAALSLAELCTRELSNGDWRQLLLVASTNVGQVGEPTLKSRHLFNLSRPFVVQASGNYPLVNGVCYCGAGRYLHLELLRKG